MSSFTSRLVARISTSLQHARVARFDDDEKRAVLTLLHGVAIADGVLSAGEDEAMKKVAAQLGTSLSKDLMLPEAVSLLAKKSSALKLACLLVADAFFADGDYDKAEKEFVSSFQTRFGLDANPLKDAVDHLRKEKLDDALTEWSKDI